MHAHAVKISKILPLSFQDTENNSYSRRWPPGHSWYKRAAFPGLSFNRPLCSNKQLQLCNPHLSFTSYIMSGSPVPNGTYLIQNVQTGYVLDLQSNQPDQGATIWIYKENDTTAQQWVLRDQTEPAAKANSVTIQSNNTTGQGLGFFAANKQAAGEQVLYTRFAWTIRLIDAGNDNYRLAYTKGEAKLVLSVLSVDQPLVRLAEINPADVFQLWRFVGVPS